MTEENGKEEFDLGQRQTLLMMKAFLCSETLFFVALIIGFVFFRHYTSDWAESQRALDWKTSGTYTVALILSSLTLNFAWSPAMHWISDSAVSRSFPSTPTAVAVASTSTSQ